MIKIIIQGPQGCGKTRISRVIEEALIKDEKTSKLEIQNFGEDEKLFKKNRIPYRRKDAEISIFSTNMPVILDVKKG